MESRDWSSQRDALLADDLLTRITVDRSRVSIYNVLTKLGAPINHTVTIWQQDGETTVDGRVQVGIVLSRQFLNSKRRARHARYQPRLLLRCDWTIRTLRPVTQSFQLRRLNRTALRWKVQARSPTRLSGSELTDGRRLCLPCEPCDRELHASESRSRVGVSLQGSVMSVK